MTKAGGAIHSGSQFTPEVLAAQIEAMAPIQSRSTMLQRGPCRSGDRTPRAISPTSSSAPATGAPVAVGPVLTPRTRAAAPAGGVPA